MKILITGICGFAGSTLARALAETPGIDIIGMDNLIRPGSHLNRESLTARGIKVIYGDIRNAGDFDLLGPVDWVIDAAANPSVLAGVDGKTSSRQLIEHNLVGTINVLEYCKRYRAGFVLLSTSRVYSINELAAIKLTVRNNAYHPDVDQQFPLGISPSGIDESYSSAPPVSLYGSTKVASEHLALEFGSAFNFPVWINRCGVMAGPGQFGHPAQGIFAYWIHSFREHRPLKYIGFGGNGYQVRDCLHPRDITSLLLKQFSEPSNTDKPRVINVSGGIDNSMSLRQLTAWCDDRFGKTEIESVGEDRAFDIPWIVLNNGLAKRQWGWEPRTKIHEVLEEIAKFAEGHPDWSSISNSQ